MRLGKVIRRWRQVIDIDQREAGRRMGISNYCVSRLENEQHVSDETVEKVFRWLRGKDRRQKGWPGA